MLQTSRNMFPMSKTLTESLSERSSPKKIAEIALTQLFDLVKLEDAALLNKLQPKRNERVNARLH